MIQAATITRTPPKPADDAPHLLAGRRRPPHPRSVVALSLRRGLPRHHRDERDRRPRQAQRPAFRPVDPRRHDARRNRLRSRPLHPHLFLGADHHADRAPRGRSPDRGPADRRRRLCRKALRAARTGAAHRQYSQAHARRRRWRRWSRSRSGPTSIIWSAANCARARSPFISPIANARCCASWPRRAGETVPRSALTGNGTVNERAVDVQINRLRRKIETRSRQSRCSCRRCAASAIAWSPRLEPILMNPVG